jgi:DNA-binding NarL/FixJ family response regulator
MPMPRNPIRLLVVDDHPAARKAMIELLREDPDVAIVGQAADGQEALQQITQMKPEAVLLDVRMPILDGVATAQIIHHTFPSVHVIGLTVGPDDPVAVAMCRAGAEACVSKQDFPALLAAIRKCRPRPAASHRSGHRTVHPMYRQHRIDLFRLLDRFWAVTVLAPDGVPERLLGDCATREAARRTAEAYVDQVIQDQTGPQSAGG